jgi:succinate dehydrogenase / fumarate reductase iron-sulfur subunit
MPPSSIQIEIKRQSAPDQPAVKERFSVPYRPGMNITSVLGEIALNPVTADGKPTTPVTYDSNCLEEICGSCAMRINGKAMMACSALVDKLLGADGKGTITLEPLSNCISCTICMEVCPQFNDVTNFVGAATIAQAKLFNMDPAGSVLKEERLRALAGDGGVQECGFAQNCVQACPKQLPLTEAISDIGRDAFVQQVKDLFRR